MCISGVRYWHPAFDHNRNLPCCQCICLLATKIYLFVSARCMHPGWQSFLSRIGLLLCRVYDIMRPVWTRSWRMGHDGVISTLDPIVGGGVVCETLVPWACYWHTVHEKNWNLPCCQCTETCSHVLPRIKYIYHQVSNISRTFVGN